MSSFPQITPTSSSSSSSSLIPSGISPPDLTADRVLRRRQLPQSSRPVTASCNQAPSRRRVGASMQEAEGAGLSENSQGTLVGFLQAGSRSVSSVCSGHGRGNKEGCGDSEVEDTASCCNGEAIDFQLLFKESQNMKESMTYKVCESNEVTMFLLPCRHLCLCKNCESKLSFYPLCQSSKFIEDDKDSNCYKGLNSGLTKDSSRSGTY